VGASEGYYWQGEGKRQAAGGGAASAAAITGKLTLRTDWDTRRLPPDAVLPVSWNKLCLWCPTPQGSGSDAAGREVGESRGVCT